MVERQMEGAMSTLGLERGRDECSRQIECEKVLKPIKRGNMIRILERTRKPEESVRVGRDGARRFLCLREGQVLQATFT